MNCPHETTTTLSWLYGDGPEEHIHHIAACPVCTAVVDEHAEVLTHVSRHAPSCLQTKQPSAPPPRVRWTTRVGVVATVGMALAAAWLFAVKAPPAPSALEAPTAVYEFASFDDDTIDQGLDDLEEEISLLREELASL
jgi:hypothetical protein